MAYYILTPPPYTEASYSIEDVSGELSNHLWRFDKGLSLKEHIDIPQLTLTAYGSLNAPLSDLIHTVFNLLIVSPRLQEFFKTFSSPEIDYHKVHLLDTNGNLISDEYVLVNPLNCIIDCVDTEKSQGRLSLVDKGEYAWLTKLMLNHARIPKNTTLFRPLAYPSLILVREDFKVHIEKLNLTGIRFTAEGEDCDFGG